MREHDLCNYIAYNLHSNLAQSPGNAGFVGNSHFWVNAAIVIQKQDRMFFCEDRKSTKYKYPYVFSVFPHVAEFNLFHIYGIQRGPKPQKPFIIISVTSPFAYLDATKNAHLLNGYRAERAHWHPYARSKPG